MSGSLTRNKVVPMAVPNPRKAKTSFIGFVSFRSDCDNPTVALRRMVKVLVFRSDN